MADYDAFVLVSFGGPEGPADVMPFLENVTRGRGVPRERLAEVAHHYDRFGGVSPINQQCRDLLAAIEKDFAASGLNLPLYWGNRNWRPYLADTVAEMAAHGVRRAIAFVTSAYGSYSGCRQYLDDIENARAQAGPAAPRIDKIRHFFNHPGFIGPFTEAALAAIESLPPGARAGAPLVFTAHSVPESMAAASGPDGGLYPAQLAEAARLVAAGVAAAGGGERPWRLVFQSRSGPPSVPWLGPDVCDHLADLAAAGAPGAVMVPVGFVSDHLEVLYDLDVEAAQAGRRLGLPLARAATPGTHPHLVSMITELVRERAGEGTHGGGDGARGGAGGSALRTALGGMGPGPDDCPDGCCRPRPAARGAGRPGGAA
ncbi:MAG TPA: ferrochelatase [Streptosporangiaceae bacterium]|nr:ferrochelatase [Streptosporangiaceae bacterium]